MSDFYDELEFPQRAEYLEQYANYVVDIAHWRTLSTQFQRVFRQVYSRRSAAVLLVHGPQGAGKSLFSARLESDHRKTVAGSHDPDLRDNLWHVLIAPSEPNAEMIREITRETSLTRIDGRNPEWLTTLKAYAKGDTQHRVRVFLLDDAHKDGAMRPWTTLSASDFLTARSANPDAVYRHVAEQINDACRHEFQRSIFVMLSNDREWVDSLKAHLDRWYAELATVLTLPLPEAPDLERLVRVNTNRLNKVSYWYWLDASDGEHRRRARQVLLARAGFTESFRTVSDSFDPDRRRRGRSANPNVLTLVTLGAERAAVDQFLQDREIDADALHAPSARHIGDWHVRGAWASRLAEAQSEPLRRARMLESEFMLRWVNLGLTATAALVMEPTEGDLGSQLLAFILRRPSIAMGDKGRESWREATAALDAALEPPAVPSEQVTSLETQFQKLGQRRSTLYEPALRRRFGPAYGRAFKVFPSLRPDMIAGDEASPGEYRACALTQAPSDSEADLRAALLRTGHAIEFTSFLRENLEGLDEYLRKKIAAYASLLESV